MGSVGLVKQSGLYITDIIPYVNFIPTIALAGCVEELVYCEGPEGSCDGKMMAPKADGFVCAPGINCHRCDKKYTYWYGKAAFACGNEPGWADGSVCGRGTTCKACKNGSTYWWGK